MLMRHAPQSAVMAAVHSSARDPSQTI